jgi:glyoxylase-like metal-dependent hydrolase (beta-lactamase superfamily II)
MMIQIQVVAADGPVHRLTVERKPLGLPAYRTAAYWVDGLLIDTGCAHTALQMATALHTWHVDCIVNTHSHEDHIGANSVIQNATHCPILAHREALPILASPKLQPLQPYRRLYWGVPAPSRAQPIGEWVETPRFRFQVLRTPGHSLDHICLFEPDQGWLFSGDAYIGGKDRALRKGYDIQAIITSLQALSRLPVETIFSGSGSVRHNAREAILAKITYLEELGQQIWALRDQGISPRQIRRRVLGQEPFLTYVTLGHFSAHRLVRSFLQGPALAGPEPVAEDQEPPPQGEQ